MVITSRRPSDRHIVFVHVYYIIDTISRTHNKLKLSISVHIEQRGLSPGTTKQFVINNVSVKVKRSLRVIFKRRIYQVFLLRLNRKCHAKNNKK